ncbi:tyrosine-type recombinase/integrase [Paracoccus sp. (in: a-proteobacteria)]|uniref:tyrosine-type recombinase/integrase n=1 Tax=Paracoccus sp. TaxID=267 RepID=UPI002AFE56AD|nr:tyrosine-type recombinase/integrase [Paracoccus sp. (in: a-proteobacteria)]
MSNKASRAALPAGTHWRMIQTGLHLGYRKAKRAKSWLVRWRDGAGYKQATIGIPDDASDVDAIDYADAEKKAKAVALEAKQAAQLAASGAPLTVREACAHYTEDHAKRVSARGGKARKGPLSRHVHEPFASMKLAELSRADLRDWVRDLEDKGLSPSTVRRAANDMRAALNIAADRHHKALPAAFSLEVKAGLSTSGKGGGGARTEPQVLSDADIRRVIVAAGVVDLRGGWGGDLRRLIVLMAATGSRFSQLVRCRVSDVQPSRLRIMIPCSHKGRGDKAGKAAVPIGDDVQDLLRPAIAGRKGTDALLERNFKKCTGPNQWVFDRRGPWGASQLSAHWREIATEAGLPSDIVAYCLRHSSIVRGLREGLPIRLVAALHDTSSMMIERHYSAFVVSALDEVAARAVVPLVTDEPAPLRVVK